MAGRHGNVAWVGAVFLVWIGCSPSNSSEPASHASPDECGSGYPPGRVAYVLGAGLGATPNGAERLPSWAFAFLLSQQYDKVYLNEVFRPASSIRIGPVYRTLCPEDGTVALESWPEFCQLVPAPPENLDLMYVGRPASRIPGAPLVDVDIYVLAPNPDWRAGSDDPERPKPVVTTLADDLALLMGQGTHAYVVTDEELDAGFLTRPWKARGFAPQLETFAPEELPMLFDAGLGYVSSVYSMPNVRLGDDVLLVSSYLGPSITVYHAFVPSSKDESSSASP